MTHLLTWIAGTVVIWLAIVFTAALLMEAWDWFWRTLPVERDMDEPRKQYRKTLRTDPPALIRIKELGWRMPCGHKMHEWDSDRCVCLQCVLEGRVVARDGGKN